MVTVKCNLLRSNRKMVTWFKLIISQQARTVDVTIIFCLNRKFPDLTFIDKFQEPKSPCYFPPPPPPHTPSPIPSGKRDPPSWSLYLCQVLWEYSSLPVDLVNLNFCNSNPSSYVRSTRVIVPNAVIVRVS